MRKARGQVMVMNAAQAAERAGVRPSTVSRWVQSGRLAAGRLPTGELQIEDGVLDEFLALRTASPRSGPDATVELAVAQERIRGLEALVASQRSWLEESEARLQMVLQALPPPPPARRPWWRRWTGERHSPRARPSGRCTAERHEASGLTAGRTPRGRCPVSDRIGPDRAETPIFAVDRENPTR